jgi:hypothetical protein
LFKPDLLNRILYSLLFFLLPVILFAQQGNNFRNKLFSPADTIYLDSLSIIPNSEIIKYANGSIANKNSYTIDYAKSLLLFIEMPPDSIEISYRIFPYNFNKVYQNKSDSLIRPDAKGSFNPFLFSGSELAAKNESLFSEGLNKSGSISRGFTVGNNQDLAVNSFLNLQLSGKLSDDVYILAAITDNNIPVQPDGNTQQLQDFDQVYIQLYNDKSKLTAGDFQLSSPNNSYFMKYFKRAQGGSASSTFNTRKVTSEEKSGTKISVSAAGAVSKGKFARNIIPGVEGNQGPYRLRGSENELFIIVLSGTEKVYIDGMLMQRGQENDYVIDYNSSEITFTAKQLITKDKRIIVEFQYSDKNYARSLLQFGTEVETKKLKLGIFAYGEQDAKNQPLQQDLDTDKKELMASVGDDLLAAVYPNFNQTDFTPDQVLYKLTDTIIGNFIYDSVFVYSTSPDEAFYRVGFSLVGEGYGNYRQIKSTANGKVYEWIAPIDGIKQGNYEPVTILVTPKKRQMAIITSEYQISDNTKATMEFALSNNDLNTFSAKDSGDDQDIALKIGLENTQKISSHERPFLLTTFLGYEQVNRNFALIERFRSVEFERDWNILNKNFTQNQHISTLGIKLHRSRWGAFTYEINSFNTEREYNALKNNLYGGLNTPKYDVRIKSSYLETRAIDGTTSFLRQRVDASRKFKYFTLGGWEDQEKNLRIHNGDTLQPNSYEYFEWESFISNPDTTKTILRFAYKQRTDNQALNNSLKRATFGESYTVDAGWSGNSAFNIKSTTTYRTLRISNTELTNLQPENTILSRLETGIRILKGTFTLNSFYEIGSGLEVKREFSFLEVPAGQGVYAYLGDLDSNGVKNLNEFELAKFPDQARYIRIFTPTNEFMKTYTNQFNQALNIDPERIWGNKSGIKNVIAKFSNQTAFRIDRKTTFENRSTAFNPFISNISDTSLISTNSSLRNTFFFNRTSPVFGIDHTWQDIRNKQLFTNGFEARANTYQTLRMRWNITRLIQIGLEGTDGYRKSEAEFFANRNFNIHYKETEPKISLQPNTAFRASLLFKYIEKQNSLNLGGEKAISRNAGAEIRYTVLSKGSLLLNTNYIVNSFTGAENTTLAFEMLDGLQAGKNVTWSVSYQRNLGNNMQLNLSYNGRTAESAPTIHTGGVQVRAFF